jgi:hypothetical protein
MSWMDSIINEIAERAWREGWSTGYNAGLRDGRSDGTYWCDEEGDWRESETAQAIEAQRAATPKSGAVGDESAVPKECAPEKPA